MECSLTPTATLLINDVWSPTELLGLTPDVDILLPAAPRVTVGEKRPLPLRASVISASFERLHALWNPLSDTNTILASSGDSISKTCISSAALSVCRATTETGCDKASFSREATEFRFVCSVPGVCSFQVSRSTEMLTTFIDALHYSFPHLLLCKDSTVEVDNVAYLLCEFISVHAADLEGYFPMLFFLFETQERAAAKFFSNLSGELRMRSSTEKAALKSLVPKTSTTWFGRKPSPKRNPDEAEEDPLVNIVAIMSTHFQDLPTGFKEAFFLMLAKKMQTETLCERLTHLVAAMRGELVAESLFTDQLDLVQPYFDAATQTSAFSLQCTVATKELGKAMGKLSCAATLAVLEIVENTVTRLRLRVEAWHQYFLQYLSTKESALESGPLIRQEKALPKGCAAASDAALLASAFFVVQHMEADALMWEGRFRDEIKEVKRQVIRDEKLLFCHLYTSIFSVCDTRSSISLDAEAGLSGAES